MIIDFHAHILPGLDHGSKDVDTSRFQLAAAKRAGVNIIVASSHFYPHVDTVADFLSKRQDAWEKLQPLLTPDLPQIMLGSEILVCEGMESMKGLMNLAIGNSETILLEIPGVQWNYRIIDTIVNINEQCRGKAVLAHVDRYDEECVEALFEQGLKGQVNVDILCKKKRCLFRWFENHNVVALGSDIHGRSRIYTKFRKANSILGGRFLEIMRSSESMLFDLTSQDMKQDEKLSNNYMPKQ